MSEGESPHAIEDRESTADDAPREAVARRAYEISRSGEGVTSEENWLRAEEELRQQHPSAS